MASGALDVSASGALKVQAYVLAGGRSQRMGVDKARVPFPDRWPMAVHLVQMLESCGLQVHLVRRGASDGLPWIRPDRSSISVIYEPDGEPHPLRGVAHALHHCDQAALVVPCDVPWFDKCAVDAMIGHGGSCVAWDGDRVHPLCGVYLKGRAAEAMDSVQAGASARSFAAQTPRVLLDERALYNLNRWSDADRSDPLRELEERLCFLSEAERLAALRGERARLLQRGVLCPAGVE